MPTRIIARLDIKNDYVIKGIHLEGLRKIGRPIELANKYYENGVDEIFFMDSVASLYDRNSLYGIISKASSTSFVPKSLGGGIRNIDNVLQAFDSGADKVIINTACVNDINIVSKVASRFGSQAMVASIQAKKYSTNSWTAFIDNGREPTDLDVTEWCKQLIFEGAGEIVITSVDQEGTQRGFDLELAKQITEISSVPVTISGGCGSMNDIDQLIETANPSGIAIASCFHYNKFTPMEVKQHLNK